MSKEKLDYATLGRLIRMIDSLKEHYEDIDYEEVEISFEYLVGSMFPSLFANVQKALNEEHTKGYIEGAQSQYKDFAPSNMFGNVKVVQEIDFWVKQAKEKISYMNYDAGFHGWEGDPLKNEITIADNFAKWIKDGEALCQKALGDKVEN